MATLLVEIHPQEKELQAIERRINQLETRIFRAMKQSGIRRASIAERLSDMLEAGQTGDEYNALCVEKSRVYDRATAVLRGIREQIEQAEKQHHAVLYSTPLVYLTPVPVRTGATK